MQMLIKQFITEDSGAVTVDWVVLTAAIVGLGIAVVAPIAYGSSSVGDELSSSLSDGSVAQLDFSRIE